MKRIIKLLGLAMVLTAILVVALAGTAFAAGNGTQTQNQGAVCLSGECPCGDCVGGDCEPVGDENKYSNGGPGQYGPYKNNQ